MGDDDRSAVSQLLTENKPGDKRRIGNLYKINDGMSKYWRESEDPANSNYIPPKRQRRKKKQHFQKGELLVSNSNVGDGKKKQPDVAEEIGVEEVPVGAWGMELPEMVMEDPTPTDAERRAQAAVDRVLYGDGSQPFFVLGV